MPLVTSADCVIASVERFDAPVPVVLPPLFFSAPARVDEKSTSRAL